MALEDYTDIAVPPLRLQNTQQGTNGNRGSLGHHVATSPGEDRGRPLSHGELPHIKFHNYLRASYPFTPTAAATPSTVTLSLHAGDIVLIHSIHTNGWADGTVLDTGERGWLPTNYCEAYEYSTMKPLLKALTDFWNVIRLGIESSIELFHSQDHLRGLIAGVRYLLERSNCLTRESTFVKEHDTIRRTRKSLLSDLSCLVKSAKQFQEDAKASIEDLDVETHLDSLLLEAFKVIVRAVRFFDVWSEEMASDSTFRSGTPISIVREPILSEYPFPQIGAQSTVLKSSNLQRQNSTSSVSLDARTAVQGRPHTSLHQRVTSDFNGSFSSSKHVSRSYRVSQSLGEVSQGPLASIQLNRVYDSFLGVLASFLGSHMQSRSPTELLLTTQQAVRSCRQLLFVVEAISEQDARGFSGLPVSKESMYDRITDLVHVAGEIFRPLHGDDNIVYIPDGGRQLIATATACVRAAGDCVARARHVLEELGDFELDPARSELEDNTIGRGSARMSSPSLTPDISSTSPVVASDTVAIVRDSGAWGATLTQPTFQALPMTVQGELENQKARHVAPTHKPVTTEIQYTTDAQSSIIDCAPRGVNLDNQKNLLGAGGESTRSGSTYTSGTRASMISATSTLISTPDDAEERDKSSLRTDSSSLSKGYSEEMETQLLEQTFAHELILSQEAQIMGGSLNALVERLTSHESIPDALFVSAFYLTFRLFTTALGLAQALAYRFEYSSANTRTSELVHIRVCNVFKSWLENHWQQNHDREALPFIVVFAEVSVTPILSNSGQHLHDLTIRLMDDVSLEPRRHLAVMSNLVADPPSPILSNSQLNSLKVWKMGGAPVSVLDFDALEVARQITFKISTLFCKVRSEELLAAGRTDRPTQSAQNLRSMATLSNNLTTVVADSILQLDEAKKRGAMIKQWVRIAEKCLELNNYESLMAIVCSLCSTNVSRLNKTWEMIPQKVKTNFEALKKVVDVSRNYAILRQHVQARNPPCVPFMGMYRTDLIFIHEGNPDTRQLQSGKETLQVINMDKHIKTAKVVSTLQHFQLPYCIAEVPELQDWIESQLEQTGPGNEKQHYRRSLFLEPRDMEQQRTPGVSALNGVIKEKEKFDFLAWKKLSGGRPAHISG